MTDVPRNLRLLLIEDSEEDAFLLERQLRRVGFNPDIHRVTSEEELKAAFPLNPWELVISDFHLPRFSGMDALRLVRSMDEEIPFLLISGAIGEETAVEVMRAGASDYLLKGNLARLGPAVDRELRESAARRRQIKTERSRKRMEDALQAILVGTVSVIGVDFFRSLVRELAQSLGTKAAFVIEFPQKPSEAASIRAVHGIPSVSEGTKITLSDALLHPFATPGSADVVGMLPESLGNLDFLRGQDLAGIAGTRLTGTDGKSLGLLVVCDEKPFDQDGLATDILSIFGARAASELERMKTEREKNDLQEQLWHSQKLEAIGTLAGGISHDINNILSSIWGHAQILQMRKSLSQADMESLDGILAACRRARDLVKQILSFSRKSSPETSVVQMGEIVLETASLLRATLPSSMTIESIVDPQTPDIKADPNQMHQVLMNLCTNASQVISAESGRILMRVGPVSIEDRVYLRCQVSDNGTGIPAAVLPRIFEPFFTTKETGKGTGLGLSVVHGIIRNHGGTISVESQEGLGTTFTIDFPSYEQGSKVSTGNLSSEIPTGTSQKILVVDDEEAVSDVLCQLLEILGYEAVSFGDPLKAIEEFRQDPGKWDAVITDRTMPGMNGETLALTLHEIRPGIPIVMSSGFEGDLRSTDTRKAGIKALLPKPFQASDLAQTLHRILDE
ncbi:MAG: response regulator [Fibrobacteria bacterium]|nr:response regulator [Fibrobacteria bacterium]